MKCTIEIVNIYNMDLEYEPEEIATTFYGELMDGNHEFKDVRHIKNFINKVFPDYSFFTFDKTRDGKDVALIVKTEDYEYYVTDGMGYDMYNWYYREVW